MAGSGSTSLLDMCTASGGGPLGQVGLFQPYFHVKSSYMACCGWGCDHPDRESVITGFPDRLAAGICITLQLAAALCLPSWLLLVDFMSKFQG